MDNNILGGAGQKKKREERITVWISLDWKVLRIQEHILRAMLTQLFLWEVQLMFKVSYVAGYLESFIWKKGI